ncbi:unnamed protein product, partial [Rotaria sp. Silwood1]
MPSIPLQPSTFPVDISSIPGNPSTILVDASSRPVHTCSIPVNTSTVPGDAFSIAGDAFSIPGDAFSIPGDAFSIPGDAFSIPGDAPSIPDKPGGVTAVAASIPVIPNIPIDAQWSQNEETIAGGNGPGHQTNQLWRPKGLFVDDDQTIIIADGMNDRIVQWKKGETNGEVVAGEKGQGNQLDHPTDVLIDKETVIPVAQAELLEESTTMREGSTGTLE